ncbi:pyridoxamine 5'-phosphate oxidase family protein [Kitasatospora sp. NPDC051914]|uniref:pyridoxamine 5'-phosphate oxidase family protein n=1 Tax=Kitasatospora sp. NPDC051914 TaxID=3154945 RepID=UPI003424F9F9
MNDEAAQRHPRDHRTRPPLGARRMAALGRSECLKLLAGVPLGRVVFTKDALPAIRPVNHVVADDAIIIRTHEGAALTTATAGADGSGTVVAYEADAIDPDTHLGWSVVITGYARPVTDPDDLVRYEQLLQPWVDAPMTRTVRIDPELVTGFRLTEQLPAPGTAAPE